MRIVREEPPPPEEEFPTNGGRHHEQEKEAREPAGLSWEDFNLAAAADDAMAWTLKPFIPPSGLVVIAGEQKSGKTLWTAWLVCQVLKAGGRVLFIELEGSRGMLRDRIRLFASGPVDMMGLTIRFRVKDTIDEHGIGRLVHAANQVAPTLIVIDPLVRAMAGDENDSSEMRKLVGNLEALSVLANCPVALLHHVRKAPKEGRELLTSADVRGSSVILSAASVIAMVQKRSSEDPSEARFDVTCEDSWFEKFPAQRCVVNFKARSADEALLFVEEDGEMEKPKAGRPQLMTDQAMEAKLMAYLDLQKGPVGKRDIRTAIPGRDQRKEEALYRLIEAGRITVTGGKYVVSGQTWPKRGQTNMDNTWPIPVANTPLKGCVLDHEGGLASVPVGANGHGPLDEDAPPVKKTITCLAMIDGRVCGWPTVQGLPYCAKHPHGKVESRP